MQEVKPFYKNCFIFLFTKTVLYSEKQQQVTDCEVADMAEDIPMLTLKEKTLPEANFVLKYMKNSKSPVSDGFTVGWFFLLLFH